MLSLAPAPTHHPEPRRIDFGRLPELRGGSSTTLSARQLYYRLLHIDEHPELLPTAYQIASQRLVEAGLDSHSHAEALAPGGIDGLVRRAPEIRTRAIEKQAELAAELAALARHRVCHVLRQLAPMALLDGCWLQKVSTATTSHEPLSCALLKLYSHEVGDGYPAQHHGNCYRDLLQSLGIYLPEVASVAFTEEREIRDEAFDFPAFLLSLSLFPRTFTPEIVGLTLHYYLCGVGPLVMGLQDRLHQLGASTRFLELHTLSAELDEHAETALEQVRVCLTLARGADNDETGACWQRIRTGYIAGLIAARQNLDRGLRYLRSPEVTPHEKMLELVERKARHAFGYHSESKLGEKSLDAWMNPESLDSERFLREFSHSRYVKRGNANDSLLLKKLVAFRGPMFRIFSPEELEVMREWIDSLPKDEPEAGAEPAPSTRRKATLRSPALEDHPPGVREAFKEYERASIAKYGRMPLCDLYYYLLNIEHYPDVRPFAKQFASRWLERAGDRLRRGRRPLPFEPYSHEALDAWLDAQHSRQVASYKKKNGEPAQSREELIESTTQQAPMILIDGGWIQNAWGAGTSHTQVGCKLFHIYVDEAGNGDPELNHPNVYRELLAQMGVYLPEFATVEFSRWPGFKPQAFRVPAFWLSISQFPSHFLSETLGLNLAMELSGVGGAYRDAIDALRFYGFDPTFVELHNTIDNVSTGHTAWASEAIKCHMDEMFARGGAELAEEHWHRVWTGYRALVPPPQGLFHWIGKFF